MNFYWFCCFFRQFRRPTKEKHELDFEPPIKYPWSDNGNLNPKDFILEEKDHGVFGRAPGEINGQQFVIRNCKNSFIYLLDHINTITVDDCDSCTILTGPVRTSIFIRDCHKCHIMTACQQFRTRDCRDLTIFLACVTEPIIESSTGMAFGPYQCYYPELEAQFNAAGLSIFNCNWSDVYDFTPDPDGEANIRLLEPDEKVEQYIPNPKEALERKMNANGIEAAPDENTIALLKSFASINISFSPKDSLVPVTLGNRPLASTEYLYGCAIIAIFYHLGASSCAKTIISHLQENPSCCLVRTRNSKFSEYDFERVFGIPAKSKQAKVGSVITLEVAGPRDTVGYICEEAAMKAGALYDSAFIHVTNDPEKASHQRAMLNGLYRMHMDTH
ncbi:unnamed protein product [Calicophoron daubneyi]|uniref:Protein XRP2 n=1 Tax=Calicophoron daubneyi TaxID=300641 RepID=A0AAV2TEZ3_CALDB